MATVASPLAQPTALEKSLYVPADSPPRSRFNPKYHPHTEEVCHEHDKYFLTHFPFKNEKAKEEFVATELGKFSCYAFPLADDDRILPAALVMTLYFLIDDMVEAMNIKEGKVFYDRHKLLATKKVLPNENSPIEWVICDIWEKMRAADKELTKVVMHWAFVSLDNQVDPKRLTCKDVGSVLKHRVLEAGSPFVSATVEFCMDIHLADAERDSLSNVSNTFDELIIIMNDIYSFNKELRAFERDKTEAAFVCNVVRALAEEAGLTYAVSKRVLWVLYREREILFQDMVERKENTKVGYSPVVKSYMKGLELSLAGNERWSELTPRYQKNLASSW